MAPRVYRVMTMKEPFERAVRHHAATVLRVCRAVLGPGPDADDAWSETFLSALRAWPELDEHANVEAWLVRIAQRKAIDVVRGRERRPVPVEDVTGEATTVGTTGGISAIYTPGTDADVWAAVAALPERQRLAIAYHYLGGLPHAETAELTGSTPAAVRRAASDGIRTLRSRLSGANRHGDNRDGENPEGEPHHD